MKNFNHTSKKLNHTCNIIDNTPSDPKYKGFWLDVTHPNTRNLDRLYVYIHCTRMCHNQPKYLKFWDGGNKSQQNK